MNYKLYFVPLPPVAQTMLPPPQPGVEASSRSSKFEVLEFELLVKLIKLTVNKPIKNKPFSFILNNFKNFAYYHFWVSVRQIFPSSQ